MIDAEFSTIGLYEHNAIAYRKVKATFDNGENIASIVHATGTGKAYITLQLAYDNRDKNITWVVPSTSIKEHIEQIIASNPNLDLERDFPNLEIKTYQSFVDMPKDEIEALDIDLLVLDEFHHIGAPIWGARTDDIVETHPDMQIFGTTAYTVRDRGTADERDMVEPDTDELFSGSVVSTYDIVDAIIDGVLPKAIYKSSYAKLYDFEKMLEELAESRSQNSIEYNTIMQALRDVKNRINQAPSVEEIVTSNIKPDGKYIYFCPPNPEKGVNDIDTVMAQAREWFINSGVPEEDIVFYKTTSADDDRGKLHRDCFYNDVDLGRNNADGKLRIMFAINQYNEGVHAPNIDGVIMGRGTSSDIVFFEQLGRALSVRGTEQFEEYSKYSDVELLERAKAKKIVIEDGTTREEIIEQLIAPLIIDLAGNIDFIVDLENSLKVRLEERRANPDGTRRATKRTSPAFDIGIEERNLLEILTKLKDQLAPRSWIEWYELALIYYNKHGNIDIPTNFKTIDGENYNENGLALGNWILRQRIAFRNRGANKEDRLGKIPPLDDEEFRMLSSIKMIWDVNEYNWNKMYELAKAYYEKHGHLIVQSKFKTINGYDYDSEGESLGNWIFYQRRAYMQKMYPKEENNNIKPLSDEQVDKLDKLKMEWDLRTRPYRLAKAFYKKYGHLDIPVSFKTWDGIEERADGFCLGKWISRKRTAYAYRSIPYEERKEPKIRPLDDLEVMRFKKLEMIWDFEAKNWDEMYELAKIYSEHHGHLMIPRTFRTNDGFTKDPEGEAALGSWLSDQRKAYDDRIAAGNKQDLIKIGKLTLLGMVWRPKKNQARVTQLCEQNGLNYRKYTYLKQLSFQEISAKIDFLKTLKQPLVTDNDLHEIFFMSDINMQHHYGISREQLFDNYYSSKAQKGGPHVP